MNIIVNGQWNSKPWVCKFHHHIYSIGDEFKCTDEQIAWQRQKLIPYFYLNQSVLYLRSYNNMSIKNQLPQETCVSWGHLRHPASRTVLHLYLFLIGGNSKTFEKFTPFEQLLSFKLTLFSSYVHYLNSNKRKEVIWYDN